MSQKANVRQGREDRVFDAINTTLLILFGLAVLYPLYIIIISSISDPAAVASGEVLFLPRGFNIGGYAAVLSDPRIGMGFLNSTFYTLAGTILNVICTLLAGYSLSRKDLFGAGIITAFLIFTMYFQGGLIPTFILVRNLGLYGTRLIMIVMDIVWIYLIIIARTYYRTTIPDELLEAARIDGCHDGQFFVHVVVPLSAALTAVLALFYGVAHWNQYFRGLVYLRSKEMWPLQLVLREILILQQMIANDPNAAGDISQEFFDRSELVKYALIMVASIPMLVLYPLVQRYFVRGVMIGSVKG
ncbi:MAG: carbohydrate ABC transporter permease [Spirochaetota bacterium]